MDSQKEVENDAAELKATLDRIKQDQALHKARQVELRGVKVPEGMKSNGPVISLARMPKFYDKVTNGNFPPGDWQQQVQKREQREQRKDAGADAKVFGSKKGKLLNQFRKEAKAMGHFQKPAGRPGNFAPITTAPRILIEERRKAAIPTPIDLSVKPAPVFAPKRKRVEHNEAPSLGVLTNEEREKRLKAFTNPSSATKSTLTQGLSTPPLSDPAISPRKANIPTPTAPKLATSPVPKVQASPSVSSPFKRKDRASPAPGRPAMHLKKAPVDVFMPAKRRRVS